MTIVLPVAMVLLLGSGRTLTAEQVKTRIASNGPKATLSELHDDPAQWAAITAGISTGSPTWLEVAVSLKRISDGGASEELNLCLADGLIRDPKSVLAAIHLPDSPFATEEVCGNYEAAPETARRAGVLRWLKRQEVAIRRVGVETLQTARRECLSAILRAKSDAKEHVPE